MPETQEDRSSLGQDLNNSVQLDESLRLPQTEQHEELLDSYISNIIEFHGLTNRRDVRRGLGHTLSVVFANLSKARGLGDKFIAVSLGSGAYTNSRYNDNDLSYLNVKRVIDYLSRDQGEVEIYRGFRDESTGEGRNTRIRLRQEEGIEGEENTPEEDRLRGGEVLEEILEASSSQSPSLLSITSRALEIPVSLLPPSSPFEVMRLKDGSGSTSNLIDYHDDEWIIAERHRLEEWNRFSVTHWADIFLPQDVFSNLRESVEEEASDNSPADLEIDLTKRTLYRVFNHGSWESGGRLYGGWWQRIPSDLRKFITINGQPTCEWDFSNMQIAMLYAREGLPLESDAYLIDGIDRSYRKLIKTTMQKLLNATEGQRIRSPSADELPEGWSFRGIQEALKGKHAAIATYFQSGIGAQLQKEDADIALRIMEALKQLDILALPIHDSFIVATVHEAELKREMKTQYEAHTEQTISISDGDLLFSVFREAEDFPDQAYFDEGLDVPWFDRMEEEARSPAYAQYFRRLHAFRDQQSMDWQYRYAGSPTSW